MVATPGPRPLDDEDFAWAHYLNQANGVELSFLSPDDFRSMAVRARYALALDPEAGFLLAYDERPAPVSPNYDWFLNAWGPGFLYVDRIVVDVAERRRKGGVRLYQDLIERARKDGFKRIGCEVNIDPPNPGSLAFHDRFGFQPVGEVRLEDRAKTVRYLALDL